MTASDGDWSLSASYTVYDIPTDYGQLEQTFRHVPTGFEVEFWLRYEGSGSTLRDVDEGVSFSIDAMVDTIPAFGDLVDIDENWSNESSGVGSSLLDQDLVGTPTYRGTFLLTIVYDEGEQGWGVLGTLKERYTPADPDMYWLDTIESVGERSDLGALLFGPPQEMGIALAYRAPGEEAEPLMLQRFDTGGARAIISRAEALFSPIVQAGSEGLCSY